MASDTNRSDRFSFYSLLLRAEVSLIAAAFGTCQATLGNRATAEARHSCLTMCVNFNLPRDLDWHYSCELFSLRITNIKRSTQTFTGGNVDNLITSFMAFRVTF